MWFGKITWDSFVIVAVASMRMLVPLSLILIEIDSIKSKHLLFYVNLFSFTILSSTAVFISLLSRYHYCAVQLRSESIDVELNQFLSVLMPQLR